MKKWHSVLSTPLTWLGLGVVGLICLLLPAYFAPSHTLLNLEPYPDGLLYTVSAQNAVVGHGLKLWWAQGSLEMWTPPLYALILAIGYLFSPHQIQFFFITNLVLLLLSLGLFYKLLRHYTANPVLLAGGIGLFTTQAYFLWLPTLPMSENVGLCSFLLLLLGATQLQKSTGQVTSGIGALGLILSRYASFTVGGVVGLFILLPLLRGSRRVLLISVVGTLAIGGVLAWFLSVRGQSPFLLLAFFIDQTLHGGFYYGPQNVLGNLLFYGRTLLGLPTRFLWQTTPLISPALAFTAGLGFFLMLKQRTHRFELLFGSTLFLAHFPLLLSFHSSDARYIITTIPLLLGLALFAIAQLTERNWLRSCLVLLLLTTSLYSQKPLLREIVVSNLLGRSVAWQHQAVLNFNSFASQQSSPVRLISTLPPFIISSYQTAQYQVLPMSTSQEFLHKGNLIWGEGIQYDNLLEGYERDLRSGNKLYISNAYITHSSKVTADYELYKERFAFSLVQTGCDHACDIFEMKAK